MSAIICCKHCGWEAEVETPISSWACPGCETIHRFRTLVRDAAGVHPEAPLPDRPTDGGTDAD